MVQQNNTYIVKRVNADQNLTKSSTTLQDVTNLSVPVTQVSASYKVKVSLYVIGKADSDVKATIVGPTSSTGVIDLDITNPKINPIGTAIKLCDLTDDTLSLVVMEGVVTLDATHTGTIKVQAAQNASQNDQLTIKAGSMIEVWQVSNTT